MLLNQRLLMKLLSPSNADAPAVAADRSIVVVVAMLLLLLLLLLVLLLLLLMLLILNYDESIDAADRSKSINRRWPMLLISSFLSVPATRKE